MSKQIFPCLWFDNNAQEVAQFYLKAFESAEIISDSDWTVSLKILGQPLMLLNGGPKFTINPSVSFFVFCSSADEVIDKWDKLSEGGKVLMALDRYAWSEKYGWCCDKYGVNWQLMTNEGLNQIVPALMFNLDMAGKAEEAIQFYCSIFPDSDIKFVSRYKEGDGDVPGYINHCQFTLMGTSFIGFDSSKDYPFSFNEAISLVVTCDTQDEIDFYWSKLTDGGGHESKCGWLKDKYGMSWQIVPSILEDLMTDKNRRPKVMEAFLKMNKFDINKLIEAANG
jgi:predicted 3-demethylubiquinone-9 3-methyltransferase (glyoxalase superfamily)